MGQSEISVTKDEAPDTTEKINQYYANKVVNTSLHNFATYTCLSYTHENAEDSLDSIKPSNEYLLSTAFISFLIFTILQSIEAYLAKSEAMVGDSVAMAVDSFTYGFNLFAERMKNRADVVEAESKFDIKYGIKNDKECYITSRSKWWAEVDEKDNISDDEERRPHERAKREFKLILELVPPLISVLTLVIVTILVLRKSLKTLIIDVHLSQDQQSKPNLIADHTFGYNTLDNNVSKNDYKIVSPKGKCMEIIVKNKHVGEISKVENNIKLMSKKKLRVKGAFYSCLNAMGRKHTTGNIIDIISSDYENCLESNMNEQCQTLKDGNLSKIINPENIHVNNFSLAYASKKRYAVTSYNGEDICTREKDKKSNLNMCSAYTHVFADTLRSISVLIAALLAESIDYITPEEADATAAVLVSIIIFLSLIPLFSGLKYTWRKLCCIRRENMPKGSGCVVKDHIIL